MKKCVLTGFTMLMCGAALGQGTVIFENYAPTAGLNAPVFQSDGLTPASGLQFEAELLSGSSSENLLSIATTGFLIGTGAGYFNAGVQTLTGVAAGSTSWFQVRVWNTSSGPSFAQAQASGLANSWWASPSFSALTGGNTGVSVLPPGYLTGLGTSPVYLNSVPEPSVLGLLGLGTAAALCRNRRHKR
jgi:hypothetical protein